MIKTLMKILFNCFAAVFNPLTKLGGFSKLGCFGKLDNFWTWKTKQKIGYVIKEVNVPKLNLIFYKKYLARLYYVCLFSFLKFYNLIFVDLILVFDSILKTIYFVELN